MRFSIIIPTYNRADLLKTCLDSIKETTDLTDGEVIVVSNGCKDNTVELVNSYGGIFKVLHWPEPLGFARAVNEGMAAAQGDYFILLNNDIRLFSVPNTTWVDILLKPFKQYRNVGITGPQFFSSHFASTPCVFFFCVAISREVYKVLGGLNEEFKVGGNEDLDYCIKAYRAGFTIHKTTISINEDVFPIFHAAGLTRGVIPNYKNIMEENNALFRKMYGEKSI